MDSGSCCDWQQRSLISYYAHCASCTLIGCRSSRESATHSRHLARQISGKCRGHTGEPLVFEQFTHTAPMPTCECRASGHWGRSWKIRTKVEQCENRFQSETAFLSGCANCTECLRTRWCHGPLHPCTWCFQSNSDVWWVGGLQTAMADYRAVCADESDEFIKASESKM